MKNSVWETIFQSRQWGKYPPEELIRFIARNFYQVKNRQKIKILEIGCGPGANLWYLTRERFSVYGIDFSKTAIAMAQKRLRQEKLKATVVFSQAQKLPWPDNFFDAVVDIECLVCNSEKDSQKIIAEILRVLRPGGKHFSIIAKYGCWGDRTGKKIDITTREDVRVGPYAHTGRTRFATLASLKSLYRNWQNLNIESIIHSVGNRTREIHQWQIIGEK